MTTVALILLARVLHILGGVIWAGSTFLLTWVIFPIGAQHAADGAGRWVGMIARKAGPVSGISAMLTVLSGIYLMLVIHPGDRSAGGLVLQAGALAAVLSFFVGIFVGRPAGQKLLQLMQQQSSSPTTAELAQREGLRKRAAISSMLTALLLVLAVLAMATFRYVQALA
ncbi:MAG TPA: hypothetical protein VFV69_23250 [Steroidobacteraceae bacterium]|nr:hypothetical protein [Steroidobacteraceae bacterium]